MISAIFRNFFLQFSTIFFSIFRNFSQLPQFSAHLPQSSLGRGRSTPTNINFFFGRWSEKIHTNGHFYSSLSGIYQVFVAFWAMKMCERSQKSSKMQQFQLHTSKKLVSQVYTIQTWRLQVIDRRRFLFVDRKNGHILAFSSFFLQFLFRHLKFRNVPKPREISRKYIRYCSMHTKNLVCKDNTFYMPGILMPSKGKFLLCVWHTKIFPSFFFLGRNWEIAISIFRNFSAIFERPPISIYPPALDQSSKWRRPKGP